MSYTMRTRVEVATIVGSAPCRSSQSPKSSSSMVSNEALGTIRSSTAPAMVAAKMFSTWPIMTTLGSTESLYGPAL
jgi:hypothetical protein